MNGAGPRPRATWLSSCWRSTAAVSYERSTATPFQEPDWYVDALRDFAIHYPADADVLWTGWARRPRYYVGGLVPSDAKAMTMDLDVFCSEPPNIGTWLHELVHVTQYGEAGPARFLINMLGSEAASVLVKLARGEKFDLFKNSAYEVEAYALENRYWTWSLSPPGKKYPVGPSGPAPPRSVPPG